MTKGRHQSGRSRWVQLLAVSLCFCLGHTAIWAADARTSDTERAEAKVIEAKAFFKSALYPQAATSYLQAFAISRKPATLFNAARAYEEAKLYAEAVALFEQYQQLADAPADGRQDAGERIAHDRAQLAAPALVAKPAEAAQMPEAKTVEAKPAGRQAVDVKPSEAVSPTDQPAEGVDRALPPSKPSNWVSWALFAGGDTLAVVGLLGYLGAINTVNQANAMDFSALGAEADYKSRVSQAHTARGGAIVAAAVGAGLAGWGAWRLWGPGSNKPAEAEAKSTSWLAPSLAPNTATITWGGRF